MDVLKLIFSSLVDHVANDHNEDDIEQIEDYRHENPDKRRTVLLSEELGGFDEFNYKASFTRVQSMERRAQFEKRLERL